MLSIADIAALLAISQLIFVSIVFLFRYTGTVSKLISLLCACVACFTLASMPSLDASPLISYLLYRFATLTPFVLWLIAFSLFTDNDKIHPLAWAAIGYFVIVRGAGLGIAQANPEILDSNINFTFIQIIPEMILLFFSSHTLFLSWIGYKADLIEHRRRLRVTFVVSMGILLLIILGTSFINLLSRFASTELLFGFIVVLTTAVPLYIFFVTLLFNVAYMKLRDSALSLIPFSKPDGNGISSDNNASNNNAELLARTKKLMAEDKLFMQTGLTIASLATALDMQEYRLRRIINQELGYKNFNQFLNNYRIEAASALIMESDISISNIALDVGYGSLSVFNKAFKERFKITPSEYRSSIRE
jgi:AraC-like DNA-binding protein